MRIINGCLCKQLHSHPFVMKLWFKSTYFSLRNTVQQSLENIKCLPLFSLMMWFSLRSKQVH